MKFFTAVALLCGVFFLFGNPENCLADGENEVDKDCGGSCVQKSCQHPDADETDCLKTCVWGRACAVGYLREVFPGGRCILQSECPPTILNGTRSWRNRDDY